MGRKKNIHVLYFLLLAYIAISVSAPYYIAFRRRLVPQIHCFFSFPVRLGHIDPHTHTNGHPFQWSVVSSTRPAYRIRFRGSLEGGQTWAPTCPYKARICVDSCATSQMENPQHWLVAQIPLETHKEKCKHPLTSPRVVPYPNVILLISQLGEPSEGVPQRRGLVCITNNQVYSSTHNTYIIYKIRWKLNIHKWNKWWCKLPDPL